MSTQSPSDIAREAKERHATLKELLKTKEPFDKEIDFPRKDLRKRYLSLLFLHPYAKESKDAETHLWMQTSYAFISEYKSRITQLDRIIQRQQQQQPQQNQPRHGPHGPVEYRKLLQRFRQFLADEEKSWTQFVLRFQQVFALDKAKPVLASLGIMSEEVEFVPDTPRHGRNYNQFPPNDPNVSLVPTTAEQRESRVAILGKALVCLGDIARYRELYNDSGGRPRAGHEDAPPTGGKRARNKRGGFDIPRPRNYEKAKSCYEQAKFLVPHEGNPSHQLAILANYSKDTFASIVHYYRALCLRQPYDTALENLNTTLQKGLELQSKRKKEGVTVPADIAHVPKVRIDLFKDKIVVLHALWRLAKAKNDSSALDKAEAIFNEFYSLVSERHLPEDFIVQVIVLAQGALWKHRMLKQASDHRKSKSDVPVSSSDILPRSVTESRIFTHLLSLYRVLLEVGIEALRDPPPMDTGKGDNGELAQRIAVEFRRTLPALRIASKWLRANFNYVMMDPEAAGTSSDSDVYDDEGKKSSKGRDRSARSRPASISPASTCTIDFWEKYAEFLRALSRTFPLDRLPTETFPLREDIEMRGWLPLKDTLDERFEDSEKKDDEADDTPHEESEVHPNVVQLMRIKDLLSDGRALVGLENSPLALYGNQFVLKGVESDIRPVPAPASNRESANGTTGHPRVQSISRFRNAKQVDKKPLHASRGKPSALVMDDEDVMTEVTSKTDDDVVREAFEHLDYSEEEDEIVWNPKASPVTSPVLPSPIAPPSRPLAINQSSKSPVNSTIIPSNSPLVPPSVSPVRPVVPAPTQSPFIAPAQSPFTTSKPATRVAPTTAEDLLNGFMGLNARTTGRTESPRSLRKTSDPVVLPAPAPAFMFGADRPGNSIWSASQDELGFSSSPGGGGFVSEPSGHVSGGSMAGVIGQAPVHVSNSSLSGIIGQSPGHLTNASVGAVAPGLLLGSPEHHHALSSSQDLSQSQSIWGSYPISSQMSQHNLPGGLPSTSFAAPPVSISTDTFTGSPQHRRVPSASVAQQLFPSRNGQTVAGSFAGQFGYASPAPQLDSVLGPQNVFNAQYANVHAQQQQQPIPRTLYDSALPVNSPSQGLPSHVLPESRLNQQYMPSVWSKVG